MHSEVIYFLAT